MTTLYRLTEEVQRMLNGGNEKVASKTSSAEIRLAIMQAANQMLKMELLANEGAGEMIPNGASLATYDGLVAVPYKDVSKITLPFFPIKLPRNLGVYQVFPTASPAAEYIPLQNGQAALIAGNPVLNSLSGNIGYYTAGMDLIFTSDISGATVAVRLIGMDFTQYSDYDPLPLPPEYEMQIKQTVFQLYMAEPISDDLIDPSSSEQRGEKTDDQKQN